MKKIKCGAWVLKYSITHYSCFPSSILSLMESLFNSSLISHSTFDLMDDNHTHALKNSCQMFVCAEFSFPVIVQVSLAYTENWYHHYFIKFHCTIRFCLHFIIFTSLSSTSPDTCIAFIFASIIIKKNRVQYLTSYLFLNFHLITSSK